MEAEQFDEAVRYYEKAMQDDPGDTEVATKLYEARTRMVMANLIKVRMQRQSNQNRSAAIQLNKSLHNLKRWKIIADSGVKATIEDEVLEGGRWLKKELNEVGLRKDHNRFYYTLKQFNYILASGLADESINKHQAKMKQQGVQQCNSMKTQLTPQAHYLYEAWQAYCGVFAIQAQYELSKDRSRYTQPNVSARQLKVSRDAGISGQNVASDIAKSIANHPWFSDQAAASLNLNLDGRIQYSVKSVNKTLTHHYKIYNETYELIKDPKDKNKVIRKLLNRKAIPKTVEYAGREYTEIASHSVSINGRVLNKNIQASDHLSKEKNVMLSHNLYFKSEKINPVKPKYKNKQAWKRSITNNLTNQVKKQLDNAWVNTFCSDQNIEPQLSKNEHAIRCSVLNPSHGTVTAWTNKEFGLTLDQLNVMLY